MPTEMERESKLKICAALNRLLPAMSIIKGPTNQPTNHNKMTRSHIAHQSFHNDNLEVTCVIFSASRALPLCPVM
jgi:hypothetical protein